MSAFERIGRALALGVVVALAPGVAMPGAAAAQDRGNTIELETITSSLSSPVAATHAGDGSGRLFVNEKPGRVRIIQGDDLRSTPFLDITSKVVDGGEQGLLGLAFHPQYENNRRFFVSYTREDRALVVAEYQASSGDPNVASTTERVIIVVPHPDATNHNGGQIQFGPDGYLYISTGDGGPQGDPENDAQNLTGNLLGKILRIDVNSTSGGRNYAIPSDNPFATHATRLPEIWAYGFRNPWRFSFDRGTGALYVADVGQNLYEEIDVVTKGGNYGWPIMEATHCYRPASGCDTDGLILPVYEYPHGNGACSVTGGYVYRGSRSPQLVGTFIFADYCGSTIWGLVNGSRSTLFQGGSASSITSFAEDETGEIYVLTQGGSVSRIEGPAGGCVLTCPSGATATDEDGNGSEAVTFDLPTTTGDCGTVTCEPASGSSFPVGRTEVNCSAGSAGSCSFFVTVPPRGGFSVTGIDPSSGSRRQTIAVTIAGTGFVTGATVSFGAKIQVMDAVVVSPTEIQATIKIKKKAKRGARDVTVTNGDMNTATVSGLFSVN